MKLRPKHNPKQINFNDLKKILEEILDTKSVSDEKIHKIVASLNSKLVEENQTEEGLTKKK